jgi:hypothetical protein
MSRWRSLLFVTGVIGDQARDLPIDADAAKVPSMAQNTGRPPSVASL